MRSARFPGAFLRGTGSSSLALVLAIGPLACGGPADGRPGGVAPPASLAITGVHVIPMDGERVLKDHVVLIDGGFIREVVPRSEARIPASARRVDGGGGYLLPGLADMHVHLRHASELSSYLAHGVTTVANLSGSARGAPDPLTLRERVETGRLPGPTILTSGPILDGDPPIFGAVSTVVTTPAEGAEAVGRQAAAGYDLVKVYNNLEPDVLRAVAAEAEQRGMPVFGHIPRRGGRATALQRALEAGLDVIAHGEELFFTYFYPGVDSVLDLERVPYRDERAMSGAVALIREADAAVIPNLSFVAVTRQQLDDPESVWRDPEASFLSDRVRGMWREGGPADRPDVRRFDLRERAKRPFVQNLTRALQRAGVPLLLGTDASARGLFPGKSAHLELRELVAAGLTPYEALSAATRNAGEFARVHLSDSPRFGVVAPGARADLLLVRGDPLEDVERAADIAGVVVRGRWLPGEELEDLRLRALGRAAEAE